MKAKLEVEMPEGCYDCQFCAGIECGVVEGMPTIDLFGEEETRPGWCPLIPEEIMDDKSLTGWIPVTERLPDEEQNVLVTDKNGCVLEARCSNGEWYIVPVRYVHVKDVVAWMPLPEPYRP